MAEQHPIPIPVRRPGRNALLTLFCVPGVLLMGCGGDGGGGPSQVTQVVGASGGTVSLETGALKGAAVIVPAGSLATDESIRIQPGEDVTAQAVTAVGPAASFGPSGTTFASPVSIALPYDPALIPAGRSEADLRVLQRKDQTGEVIFLLPTAVDAAGGLVTIEVTGFSTFQVVIPPAPDPALIAVSTDRQAGVLADGIDAVKVTVTVRDANGNPIGGQTVQVLAAGGGTILTQPAGSTGADGVASATLTSTLPGTKTVTVTVNPGAGEVVAGQQPTVEFIAPPVPPSITLASPNGGETLAAGSTHTIVWTTTGVTSVAVRFSADGGTTWNAIASLNDTSADWQKYPWTVPAGPSSDCRVRVEDSSDASVFDASDAPFVIQGPSAIVLTPSSLSFTAAAGGGKPAGQSFAITNGGPGTLQWTATVNQSWLAVTPASGDTTAETDTLTVDVDTTGLAAGTYAGFVTVSDPAAGNNPQTLAVTVTVTASAANQVPVVSAGSDATVVLGFALPLQGTVTDDGKPGGALTISWSNVSGPGTVSFTNPTLAQTSAIFSAAGTYVLRLTASDGALQAADDLTVTVSLDLPPPVITFTTLLIKGITDEAALVTVSMNGGAAQSDQDADPLKWERQFNIPDDSVGTSYRCDVNASDSSGNAANKSITFTFQQ